METVLGIMLLLQVIVLIQMILVKKQVLQKIDEQEKNIENKILNLKEQSVTKEETENMMEMLQYQQKTLHAGNKITELNSEQKAESAEELIHQVLSEVFS